MLALTDSAVVAVKNIVSSLDEGPETCGLRVTAAREGMDSRFQLSIVALPAEGDEVIEEDGARIFLETEAAALLDDKLLDASVEESRVAFTIKDRS